MASIFTFDPDPPRVSSPWSTPVPTPPLEPTQLERSCFGGLLGPAPTQLVDHSIAKLAAEPQDGPTEYKLHLLLRPRRSFSASPGTHASASYRAALRASGRGTATISTPLSLPPPTLQSRQNRLQHLTTQLLWRLQQSSPYHSSSTVDLVLPVLPDAALTLSASPRPGKLLPGLEDSRGALYEIGVADDGTFVGLTHHEMDESILTLRAMAASLGCRLDILRTVIVGECEWSDAMQLLDPAKATVHSEELWVAEVLVVPDTHQHSQHEPISTPFLRATSPNSLSLEADVRVPEDDESQTEQLRIALTGSTTSGKSSLLGTLSTSTLDNGRGKSRLSLLKHRHEIASGITSSVAPELIGYGASALGPTGSLTTGLVNYACRNVSSWIDIHNAAEGGRLIFITDSAGHPRYRRTTLRGLLSWAPHWTVCCVGADDSEDSAALGGASLSPKDTQNGYPAAGDLSKAHLELCLKLELPLVVVITKYDLASKSGLRQTLTKILSIVKAGGRQPVMLRPELQPMSAAELQTLSLNDEVEVRTALETNGAKVTSLVPILLTSAVTGSGIRKLHALLRHLPVPPVMYDRDNKLATMSGTLHTLFHVDEVYVKADDAALGMPSTRRIYVLSGHLARGSLALHKDLLLGPFPPDDIEVSIASHSSAAHPSLLNASNLASSTWQRVRVVSIRNLRLPVRRLLYDQVGTVGVEFTIGEASLSAKPRKGMVLAGKHQQAVDDDTGLIAATGFCVRFSADAYLAMEPGALYTVYCASVRAAAKLVSVISMDDADADDDDNLFAFDGFDLEHTNDAPSTATECIDVAFQLVGPREYLALGARVLVMPASGAEASVSLAAFVGHISRLTPDRMSTVSSLDR